MTEARLICEGDGIKRVTTECLESGSVRELKITDVVTRPSALLLQVFNFWKRFIFNLAVPLNDVFEGPVKI